MIRSHEGHSLSYYKIDTDPNDIFIGFAAPGGGTSGEFRISWESVGSKATPVLHAYDDGWSALYHCQDLLKLMAGMDSEDVSQEEFVRAIESIGICRMGTNPEKKKEVDLLDLADRLGDYLLGKGSSLRTIAIATKWIKDQTDN